MYYYIMINTLIHRAMYWSIMIENDNTRRDQIDICNMAHETNKAMSDQSNTLWLAGGEGDQGSTTFFYRHFPFLVIRSKCFYSRSSSPNSYMRSTEMRISIQYKVHKVADFFTQSLSLDPIDSGSPSRCIRPALNKPYALPLPLPLPLPLHCIAEKLQHW